MWNLNKTTKQNKKHQAHRLGQGGGVGWGGVGVGEWVKGFKKN